MSRVTAALLACAALSPGCMSRQPLPTVPGPENPELARSSRLQVAQAGSESILLRRLSDGSVRELPVSDPVVELSGPDREGRVAYLSTSGSRRSTRLWVDTVDPSPPVQVFPLREGEKHFSVVRFALSPVNGRLAFVSMRAPRAYALEVLDLATGDTRTLSNEWCSSFAWFPDGKRLVFAAFDGTDGSRGSVHVVDCVSGALERTWNPKATVDGLWVGPGGSHVYAEISGLWRLDVATGQHENWSLPGLGSPIAFSQDGKVLAFALPTEGSELDYTHSLPPRVVPGEAVKLFDVSTREFCTVSPQIGLFRRVSAGEVGL